MDKGNTGAANFLMQQQMTGQVLLRGLNAAAMIPEEAEETPTILPGSDDRAGVHVAPMDDYQHSLVLEGGFR